MNDIAGQESFYKVTAEERLRLIEEANAKLQAINDEIAANLTARKKLRESASLANAELLTSTRSGSTQRMLEFAEAKKKIDNTEISIKGADDTISKRNQRVRAAIHDASIAALRAAGGSLSNKDLASLIGQDSHGLSGLLCDCDLIEKIRTGRMNNEVVAWKLK